MRTTHPLDRILGAPARVAALRVLAGTKIDLTGREVSRLAGVSHPQANAALARLAAAGLVQRRRAGRAAIYRLNARPALVRRGLVPLFRVEEGLLCDGLDRFKREARAAGVVSATLFGSRARGDAAEGSDADILIVMKGRDARLEERLRTAAGRVSAETGIRFAPLVLTAAECRSARGQKRELLRAAVKEGRPLAGRPLEDLVGA